MYWPTRHVPRTQGFGHAAGGTQVISLLPPSASDSVHDAVLQALGRVRDARFFESERGYHGRFYCALLGELERRGALGGGLLLEMEYQKSSRHGITQRPDIVLHFPTSTGPKDLGNLAVFALKRRATEAEAREDFVKLDEMCRHLRYQQAFFINVDSRETHSDAYRGAFASRLTTLAVQLGANLEPRVIVSRPVGDP